MVNLLLPLHCPELEYKDLYRTLRGEL